MHSAREVRKLGTVRRKLMFVIGVVCLTFAHTAALAQQPPPEPPPYFEGSAQFALLTTTGNSSTETLGLGGELAWRPAPWTITSKAVFAQNEADDVLSARSFAAAFRAARPLTTRLSMFGDYGYLHDLFAGIENRNTVAGGLGYKLIDLAPHELTLLGGIGFEIEDRLEVEATKNAVFIGGIEYRWKVSDRSGIIEEFRYIQPFQDGENWKLDQSIALTAAITSLLSLKLSNVVRYANNPVPTFDSTDTITAAAIVLTIRRP